MNEMEQRVWQRVLGQPQQENSDLKHLAVESQEAAGEYRQLLKSRMESHRELGKRLLEREMEILSSLKGLYYLQTGSQMKLPMANRLGLDSKRMVRRYHTACRTLAEYTSRSAEPEWGTVFRGLADRQEKQVEQLCQLLGHMNQ